MRQGLSLGIVVLVALGPLVPQISVGRAISAWMASRQASNELCDYEQSSDDGTVTVSLANPPTKAGAYLLMRDYRRGITRKRLFPACWVFRVQPDGRAYLARAKSNAVEIVEWNGVNNEVTTVATTPVKGRYFAGDGWNCSVSPDGNYMALLLKSMLHDNATDLWLIDMGRGTCKLALPNADGYRQQHLEWPKGEVALWEELSGATAVNIETLAVRRITLNEEGKR